MPRIASICALGLASLAFFSGCSVETSPIADPPTETPRDDGAPSGATPTSAAAPEDVAAGAKQLVTVDVARSLERVELAGRHAEEGHVFLAVTIDVENGARAAIPLSFSRFALRTKRGDAVPASDETLSLSEPCAEELTVAPGGAARCTIAFHVRQGEAKSLVFDLPASPKVDVPVPPATPCNIVAPAGAPVKVRVSTDPAHSLEQADVPDGTWLLVRSELYTERPRDTFMIPASVVVLREGMFQEVTAGDVIVRTLGRVDSRAGGNAKLSCRSPAAEGDMPVDWVSYSKEPGELVLERPYEDGVLRRIYRQQ